MANVGGVRWPRGIRPSAPGSRTTRLELFYDLVFVFAFLRVTTVASGSPNLRGLVQCLVALALLWWCWTGFAALGNVVRTDQGIVPLLGFATSAAVFVLALSLPKAFVDQPGGLPGPLVFAVCYFLVRATQVAFFLWAVRTDPGVRRQMFTLALPFLVATGLIFTSALVPQWIFDGRAETAVRLALWLAALGVEYGAGLAQHRAGWTVLSAGHWAERHALIIIVALGESIIALGLGPSATAGLPLTWPVIFAAVLGVAVVAAMWWAYFDTLALAMEQVLHRTRDPSARGGLARDVYTYLHLPLIAGVILFALGLKGQIYEAGNPATPLWGVPLPGFHLLALYGGVALYLLTLITLGSRTLGAARWPSIVGVVLLVALVPVAGQLPELAALAVLAVAAVLVVAAQTVVDAPRRRQVRQVALEEQLASEAEQTRWRGHHL
ncbi:low temperature requirement protein A [Micromonospora peucetia]|uniref:Low temperature requirement protein A n=1 Tax=Micromonospora peucetia TaxID=47871 RepID=A0ABZ1EB66_9ACTN|nr:low temperature requirement protein A [Micromonospora peucetia]MCX4388478.1 low temperature requirement protein A [Micromonospora peucetia]WSA30860.1 low temperature requirement protein A [Micromonospora peucetia]